MTKILVMEDDAYQSRLIKRVLEHGGYEVLVAEDGQTGLQMAMLQKPDLILLDMGLPDLDGQTVAGLLKASTFVRDIPVIAVTAWPQDVAAEMAAKYGCDGYFSKPISARTFAEDVSKFLAQRKIK